jgi:hypothetical protein
MLKFYGGAMVAAVLAVIVGYMIGGLPGAWIVLVLAALETSLSFDNAVINASILQNWGATWRGYFVRFGMPVAVFGMRFAFPLAIVAIAAGLGPIETIKLAAQSPAKYAEILSSVHLEIAAFGGAFLMMLFLKYFMDEEKDVHWIKLIELPLSNVGRFEVIVVLLSLALAGHFVAAGEQLSFLMAGVWGLVTYLSVDVIKGWVGGDETTSRIIKEGIVGLLYLELIDASCSFDGVIGAFSLTTNIFMIMLGLGVGAFFVRSMTLHLVEAGTLAEYRYLEHGAFWSIGALATTMLVSVVYEVPDVVTGFIGIGLLGLALWSSIRANQAEASAN